MLKIGHDRLHSVCDKTHKTLDIKIYLFVLMVRVVLMVPRVQMVQVVRRVPLGQLGQLGPMVQGIRTLLVVLMVHLVLVGQILLVYQAGLTRLLTPVVR